MALYSLEESDRALLEAACRQLDRSLAAREAPEEHGALVEGFGQLEPNRGIKVERQAHLAFARLLRELGVGLSELPEASVPRGRGYR
jgi:phage terminase small subunit